EVDGSAAPVEPTTKWRRVIRIQQRRLKKTVDRASGRHGDDHRPFAHARATPRRLLARVIPGGNLTAWLAAIWSAGAAGTSGAPMRVPLSYGTRTVPFNSPIFVKSTAAFAALNNTGTNLPVD